MRLLFCAQLKAIGRQEGEIGGAGDGEGEGKVEG